MIVVTKFEVLISIWFLWLSYLVVFKKNKKIKEHKKEKIKITKLEWEPEGWGQYTTNSFYNLNETVKYLKEKSPYINFSLEQILSAKNIFDECEYDCVNLSLEFEDYKIRIYGKIDFTKDNIYKNVIQRYENIYKKKGDNNE